MSGRTRKANRYVRRAMCQAAWAAVHTRNTYLSAFYRRMQVRKGPQKAVMALAHHIILIVYNILKRGEEYVEVGGDFYDRQNKSKTVSRMVSRLTKLGYQVTLTPVENQEVEIEKQVLAEQPAEPAVSEESAGGTDLAAFVKENIQIPDSATSSSSDVPVQRPKRGRPCKCSRGS
jgi:hypothetical protein